MFNFYSTLKKRRERRNTDMWQVSCIWNRHPSVSLSKKLKKDLHTTFHRHHVEIKKIEQQSVMNKSTFYHIKSDLK